MLSTPKALRHFEGVVDLLAQIKAHADARPAQPVPQDLQLQLYNALQAIKSGFAAPGAVWTELLRQKVPYTLLAACSKLVLAEPSCVTQALYVAATLGRRAAADLPAQEIAGASSSSSSSSSGNSSSSSKPTALFWDQLEQSGFLQQLPGLLSSTSQQLEAHRALDEPCCARAMFEAFQAGKDSRYLTGLLRYLPTLQPSFFTAHATGQQCLAPAMHLSLASLQCASKILATGQSDPQKGSLWPVLLQTLWNWLQVPWRASHFFTYDADMLLDSLGAALFQEGSCSSQVPSKQRAAAAVAVLQSEHTARWVCLRTLISVLAQTVNTHLEPQAGASGLRLEVWHTSSTAGTTPVRNQNLQGPAWAGVSLEPWLPAVLALRLPAAYSTLLKQLGCSNEVGLLLAAWIVKCDTSAMRAKEDAVSPAFVAQWTELFVGQALDSYLTFSDALAKQKLDSVPPQPALHLSLSAVIWQWLLDVPADRLLVIEYSEVSTVALAAMACKHSSSSLLSGQHWRQLDEQQQEQEVLLLLKGYQAVPSLSMAVLDRLLGVCGRQADSGVAAGSSSSSGAVGCGSSTSSSSDGPLQDAAADTAMLEEVPAWTQLEPAAVAQLCRQPLTSFAFAVSGIGYLASLTSAEVRASLGFRRPDRRNVAAAAQAVLTDTARAGHGQSFQLLQECTRLLVATAASCTADSKLSMLTSVLQPGLQHLSTLFIGAAPERLVGVDGSPLVAVLAAGGDAASPSALQAWGLLCSMLKFYSASAGDPAAVQVLAGAAWESEGVHVASAVLLAVSAMLKAALTPAAAAASQGSSSGTSSSMCAAALPWLVLLGRCCLASAFLAQHWRCMLESDSSAAHSEAHPETTTALSSRGYTTLASTLQQLQQDLASVLQWLSAGSTVQQLVALGCKPKELQQQLSEAAEALGPLRDQLQPATDPAAGDPPSAAQLAALSAIQQQLQAAGMVLTCFAIPHACNNPACANVSGPSEAQLVGGRSCICAGCRTARYCGRACQRQAWRQHKPVCQALAAATVAAPVAPAAGAAQRDSVQGA